MKWFEFTMGISQWEVHLAPTLGDEECEVWGECDFGNKHINLNQKLTEKPEELVSCLIHEMIHAAEQSLGYEWDESIVRSLEFALAPVLYKFISFPALPQSLAHKSSAEAEEEHRDEHTPEVNTALQDAYRRSRGRPLHQQNHIDIAQNFRPSEENEETTESCSQSEQFSYYSED